MPYISDKSYLVESKDLGGALLIRWAQEGEELALHWALLHGPDQINATDADGCTAFIHAVMNSHHSILRRLLAEPALDVNIIDGFGRTALSHAVSNINHPEIVRMLLEDSRVDVNLAGESYPPPLSDAATQDDVNILRMLLAAPDIDVNILHPGFYNWTPLHYAVESDRPAAVRMLLERDDVDAEPQDTRGWTPMFVAGHVGSAVSEQLLLLRNALM